MNIASRTHSFITASLVFVGLAASASHAQTVMVNGAACAAATVTLGAGTININTGGCGTPVVTPPPPPPSSPPSISSLSVSSGAPGAAVTINGANLGGATVTIAGLSAFAGNNSGTQIFTNVPNATPGVGTVVVTTSIGTASAAFTVNSPPPPVAPAISLVSPATGAVNTLVTITGSGLAGATVTIGGAAAAITTSSSTSITTSVPAGAVVGAGNVVVTTAVAPAASFGFTVTTAPVGCSDVSIDGVTLPCPSKQPASIPTHAGLGGAGPEVNAYAMPPARCFTTPALTRSWQHNIDRQAYKERNAFDFFVLQANESLSYKFTVGDTDASGGFLYNDAPNANIRPSIMSITAAPCDFDTSKLVTGLTRDSCYQTGINGNSINWANITGTLPAAYCRLVKGQTYYLNIRFQDGRPASLGGSPTTDSCVSGNCGGFIQVL